MKKTIQHIAAIMTKLNKNYRMVPKYGQWYPVGTQIKGYRKIGDINTNKHNNYI